MQGLNTTICVLRKNFCQQAVFVDIVDHVSGSIDVSQCNNLRKIGLRQNNDLTCEHIILSTNQRIEVVIQNGTSIPCTVGKSYSVQYFNTHSQFFLSHVYI